eukprot:3033209-Amphidinium_carterae.1
MSAIARTVQKEGPCAVTSLIQAGPSTIGTEDHANERLQTLNLEIPKPIKPPKTPNNKKWGKNREKS